VSRAVLLIVFLVSQSGQVLAEFTGGIELKSTHQNNYNLAYGGATEYSERINTTQVSLTWIKGSSKDVAWLVGGDLVDSEYSRFAYLSGLSGTLFGGMFYRFNPTNSATLKLGLRERRFDDEAMRLLEDQVRTSSLQLSHRLSATVLLSEKVVYEESLPQVESYKYYNKSGSVWLEWNPWRQTTVSTGFTASERFFEYGEAEYYFNEAYLNFAYGFARNWYARVGVSEVKAEDNYNNSTDNQTAHIAIGMGF